MRDKFLALKYYIAYLLVAVALMAFMTLFVWVLIFLVQNAK